MSRRTLSWLAPALIATAAAGMAALLHLPASGPPGTGDRPATEAPAMPEASPVKPVPFPALVKPPLPALIDLPQTWTEWSVGEDGVAFLRSFPAQVPEAPVEDTLPYGGVVESTLLRSARLIVPLVPQPAGSLLTRLVEGDPIGSVFTLELDGAAVSLTRGPDGTVLLPRDEQEPVLVGWLRLVSGPVLLIERSSGHVWVGAPGGTGTAVSGPLPAAGLLAAYRWAAGDTGELPPPAAVSEEGLERAPGPVGEKISIVLGQLEDEVWQIQTETGALYTIRVRHGPALWVGDPLEVAGPVVDLLHPGGPLILPWWIRRLVPDQE